MKQTRLRQLVKTVLGDVLSSLQFKTEANVLFRDMDSGVLHIMAISLDIRSDTTFQILCGLNARMLLDDGIRNAGMIGAKHLADGGWSMNSGRWSCATDALAEESLTRAKRLIRSAAEPWFQSHKTLSSVAAEMTDDDHGLLKARLYAADGCPKLALRSIEAYERRLLTPRQWDAPKWIESERASVVQLRQEFTDG